ncbi:PadR family transcriptional regulator [Streptacidiphilus fuscans]|uniref:PadR family transcriptional regulator n=1 Tax=Streptacidiphilus fuscans TaxID=2789292 RepID=A0A931B9N6_9ACTN|nr:PadR family transcriptional regulator [Streptacidiphilus fuscans]MBF9070313.1 PadR family transcriptional regulator [Streptacidiphilus fuscans]
MAADVQEDVQADAQEECSPSGYVVLGLIARHGPMTPYELKARTEESVQFFWPIPHAQLYRIPARLAELGLLREEAEEDGRRRRVFHLTDAGRAALARWLANPHAPEPETRDPAQLKLFFADLGAPADVVALARERSAQHRRWLDLYETRLADLDELAETSQRDGTHGEQTLARRRILTLAAAHERAYVEYWTSLARESLAAAVDPE